MRIRPGDRGMLAYVVVGETSDRLPRNQCWRAADRTERGDGRKALPMNSGFICSSSEEASPRTSRSTVCARRLGTEWLRGSSVPGFRGDTGRGG